MSEVTIDQIKECRVSIDRLSQLASSINATLSSSSDPKGRYSFQVEKAEERLLFAKAWMGKMLGKLNEASPYANDGNRKAVSDIEKTADVAINSENETWRSKNHIEKVDSLREEIGGYIKKISNTEFESRNEELLIAKTNTYINLCEARFYLGFELERLRKGVLNESR